MVDKKNTLLSLIFNGLIALITLIAAILSLSNAWKETAGLESSGIENLKYYTWDSNLFAGIISLIYVIYDILILKDKRNDIPKIIQFLKFFGLIALGVTFISIAFFFLPIMHFSNNYFPLFTNSNLFFHLITPILATITYILFDYEKKYSFKYLIIGCSSTIVYGLSYLINVLVHLNEDLTVDPIHDWYGYASYGVAYYPVSFIVTFLTALVFGLFINNFGQIIHNKLNENN